MKLSLTVGILAVIAFPALTMGAPSIPPAALGQVEATISFCAKVDSGSAAKYKEWGEALVADMTEKALKEARDSNEYKESYNAITDKLEKVPADKAAQTCRAFLSNGGK